MNVESQGYVFGGKKREIGNSCLPGGNTLYSTETKSKPLSTITKVSATGFNIAFWNIYFLCQSSEIGKDFISKHG